MQERLGPRWYPIGGGKWQHEESGRIVEPDSQPEWVNTEQEEAMRFWIEYTFTDGAVYRDPQELHWMEGDEPEGEWVSPFPNEKGNSFAHGANEGLTQSEIGDMMIDEHGAVVTIKSWRAPWKTHDYV